MHQTTIKKTNETLMKKESEILSTNNYQFFFNDLPIEIKTHIITFCSFKDIILNLSLISKFYFQLISPIIPFHLKTILNKEISLNKEITEMEMFTIDIWKSMLKEVLIKNLKKNLNSAQSLDSILFKINELNNFMNLDKYKLKFEKLILLNISCKVCNKKPKNLKIFSNYFTICFCKGIYCSNNCCLNERIFTNSIHSCSKCHKIYKLEEDYTVFNNFIELFFVKVINYFPKLSNYFINILFSIIIYLFTYFLLIIIGKYCPKINTIFLQYLENKLQHISFLQKINFFNFLNGLKYFPILIFIATVIFLIFTSGVITLDLGGLLDLGSGDYFSGGNSSGNKDSVNFFALFIDTFSVLGFILYTILIPYYFNKYSSKIIAKQLIKFNRVKQMKKNLLQK
ncbi:hypothetical protein ABK040_005932 [Willaertia magna]